MAAEPSQHLTYRESGVDIDAGDELVERIKPHAARTMRREVMHGIGGFGALCALPTGYKEPILVSGTDGVGTKLKIAFASGRHDTIGIDLVAMCVNDIATSGAEPLFFLDYFASGKLDLRVGEQVIAGIAEGCRQAGCALVGGETAELPGMYADGEYDLAGFAVGVVEKSKILDGSKVKPGDRVIGLPSSGLHSNGYSLARKALLERMALPLSEVASELLTPTKIYVRALRAVLAACDLHAAAHITGGGLVENPPRVLSAGQAMRLVEGAWPVPPIFERIRLGAGVPVSEMRRTFNLGLGMLLVVDDKEVPACMDALAKIEEPAYLVGQVVATAGAEPHVEFV